MFNVIGLLVGTAALTIVLLFLVNPFAKHLRLLDVPDGERKLHVGAVPLTGGIVLYITLFLMFSWSSLSDTPLTTSASFWSVVATELALLVLIHAVDDVIELRAVSRFLIDALLAFGLWSYAAIHLFSLGNLFGMGEIVIVRAAIVMTIFCFVAASNAFNWMDGIDGTCAGLGIICFSTLAAMILFGEADVSPGFIEALLVIVAALVPLYFANLGVFGSKLRMFLGDSGARLIGFMAAMALILAADQQMIPPVMAYFAIAVPVCDCLVLMGHRALQGRSPLSGDRMHLHHLLGDLGYSESKVRNIILLLALGFSAWGVAFQLLAPPEWVVSAFVIGSFAVYVGVRFRLLRLAANARSVS